MNNFLKVRLTSKRRLWFFILLITVIGFLYCFCIYSDKKEGPKERRYLVAQLTKIADPVLLALSRNELKKVMPVKVSFGNIEPYKTTHLEAVGRLLSGMAPWLELGVDGSSEGKLREKYINLAVRGIHNATDRKSPDYMNFTEGGQPLVDAAYLAQALLRAPHELWGRLSKETQGNVIRELKSTRRIEPIETNWLFFSAIIESALLKFDGDCDMEPIRRAITKHLEWYKGDGVYGDGPDFHWDYYNSLVIHPMFLEVLQVQNEFSSEYKALYNLELKRAQRYAAILERLISPEGTYPPNGRSLSYRFGVFQLLSKIALMGELPKNVKPQQVRSALYTVMRRQLENTNMFDKKGWLQIGVYGYQPNLAERYISTGSLYLCTGAFLVLGLPEGDSFWLGDDEDWTSKKIWKGEDLPADYALEK